MKKYLVSFLVFSFFAVFSLQAQEEGYHLVQSSGTIPDDFLTLTKADANDATQRHIKASDERKAKEYKEKFLAKSNWHLNRVLRGGSIIFNDSITNYVREVANYVLKNEPELRDELRFYTAKFPSVNAFSNDQGIVIFNTGLLAQLENEAQLAYVISHEIIHYIKKHGIKKYVEKQMVKDEISEYDSWSADEKFYLAKNNRSREMETEADVTGFKRFFSKTKYDLNEAKGAMDVLKYAYLPFNEIKFSSSFITNKHFSIPEEFKREKVQPISTGSDYDEDLSTHPKVRERRKKLARLINSLDKSPNGEKYIISEERFDRVKKLARYETIRKHMIARDYPRAFYDSYIMMQDNPDDKFLRKVVAGALYGVSIYKSTHSDSAVIEDYEDIEGESQQVYYMLDEMDDAWGNVVALQYAWSLHKKYPDDKYVEEITKDLMVNLIKKEDMHIEDFYAKSKEQLRVRRDSADTSEEEEQEKSKYQRIKEKKKEMQLERGKEAYRFAFVTIMKDSSFHEAFREAEEIVKEHEEEDDITYEDIKEEAEEEEDSDKGARLGIDRLLMIDPLFLSMDRRKDQKIKFFKSEQKQRKFSNRIKKYGNEINMDVIMLDPWDLDYDEVDKFNDIMITKDWITEYTNHEDVDIIPFTSNDIYSVLEKYDAQYVNWMGAINVREERDNVFMQGCVALPIIPPLAIYIWAKPEYSMIISNTLIDIENAELVFNQKHTIDHRGGINRLSFRIYDFLNQIQAEKDN